MEIHVFGNGNNSQTNAYSHYSNYSYSGLIPNERALRVAGNSGGAFPFTSDAHLIFKRVHQVEISTKYRADDLYVNFVCEYFC